MNPSLQTTVHPPPLRCRMPQYDPVQLDSEDGNDGNIWFLKQFPDAVKRFGPGWLQGTFDDANGLRRWIPLVLNEDAWAWALGGDRRLGHRVMFYPPEGMFYFFDPLMDAFCPTTEEKLQAMVSYLLLRCSQEVGSLVDILPLVTTFRQPAILQRVIGRAKAFLSAESSFFEGERGHRRMVDGKIIEPTAKPCYELFVEKLLTKQPSGGVTVTQAYHRYFNMCREHHLNPLTRHEFRSFAAEVVRKRFGYGLRRDLRGDNGRFQEGWFGLGLNEDAAVGHN